MYMRILHTEWSDDFGGQEKRVLSEATGLKERGHEVIIVCREHAKIRDEAIKAGIEVKTLPLRHSYDISSLISLSAFIKKREIHILNTHSSIDSWIGSIAARLAGVPVLVRTRHLNIPLKRNILNFVHYLPDAYITCGEEMRKRLVEECHFPARMIVSIPTGVDERFFSTKRNPNGKRRFGINPESPIIVNIGILRKVKGHEVTIKAARILSKVIPDAKFLLVGDGPGRKRLHQMVDEMGLKNVIFTGFLPDVKEVLEVADISVLSSWSEGIPQSLLQSMAAGVPVVATRVGGVPEVVIDGENGFLIDPGDYEGLAERINMILNDGIDEHILAKAKETVRHNHTRKKMLDKIESLYERLLSEKSTNS